MSLEAIIRRPAPFNTLPLWRKTLIVCCIASFMFGAAMLANVELDTYPSAPNRPVAETGQIYPINVNHGFIKYVTLQDKIRLELWESRAGLLCGPAMLAMFLLWVTFDNPSRRGPSEARINPAQDSRRK
jgi:hypothetical protein